MIRKIDRRITIKGELVCQAPLHVGGLESRSSADLTLAVNGAGQFYMPGTSLAGPLRAWCLEAFPESTKEAYALWGAEGGDDEGGASFVTVEDAEIRNNSTAPEIRDGVGIDRYTGAAADRNKFDREVLPAGTRLPLRLLFEQQAGDGSGAAMLAALVQALEHGEVWFGAAKSRGLGKVVLQGLKVTAQDFSGREGVLKLLRGQTCPAGGLEVLCADWKQHRRVRPMIEICARWRPVGPLMVKASVDGMVVDTLPLLTRKEGDFRLAVPGSSSKGVLRGHAARIAATLFGRPVETDFLKQLAQYPIVGTLFGTRNADEHDRGDENAALAGLSALTAADCHSVSSVDPRAWQHMLSPINAAAELPEWLERLPAHKDRGSGEPYFDPAVHVAIDRWAGGASDGALFSVLEPWNFEWEELVLTVDPQRLARHHDDRCEDGKKTALAAIALLLLTLADFAKGEVPLGYGANRGFGAVEVKAIEIAVPKAESCPEGFVRDVVSVLGGVGVCANANGEFEIKGPNVETLRDAWRDYLVAWEQPDGTARAQA